MNIVTKRLPASPLRNPRSAPRPSEEPVDVAGDVRWRMTKAQVADLGLHMVPAVGVEPTTLGL